MLTWCLRIGRIAFAQDCLLCGAGSGGAPICRACESELPLLSQGCPVCATPSPNGSVCGACLACPPRFDATRALWRYAHPVDVLVQALKFGGRIALADFFALALRPLVSRVDVLVPMPLHRARLAERGFNQAAEIARRLSRLTGSALAIDGVRRVRHTPPQTGLPLQARIRNVRGCFACEMDLTGAQVAVVDDVMTTGATLSEMAEVLKRAGAARIENWVIARTLE